ncbi:hypothetical protein Tco_0599562 [Tanacetum coccineum]
MTKFSKCAFWLLSNRFPMVHIVKQRINMDPSKVEAIIQWPRPTTGDESEKFSGALLAITDDLHYLERLDVELCCRSVLMAIGRVNQDVQNFETKHLVEWHEARCGVRQISYVENDENFMDFVLVLVCRTTQKRHDVAIWWKSLDLHGTLTSIVVRTEIRVRHSEDVKNVLDQGQAQSLDQSGSIEILERIGEFRIVWLVFPLRVIATSPDMSLVREPESFCIASESHEKQNHSFCEDSCGRITQKREGLPGRPKNLSS